MERKCKQGTTALSSAVYLGQNKLGTIHRLLEADAKLTTLNNSGASYLTLACSNEDSDPKVVRFFLENLGDSHINLRMISQTDLWRCRRFASKWAVRLGVIRDEGYAALGIPGRSTALTVSMMLASPKIVELLIEHGANADSVDVMGNDAFMLGSVFGREVNLQLWLKRFKNYDLEQRKAMLGATPLIAAVNMGANKIESVRVLCKRGA